MVKLKILLPVRNGCLSVIEISDWWNVMCGKTNEVGVKCFLAHRYHVISASFLKLLKVMKIVQGKPWLLINYVKFKHKIIQQQNYRIGINFLRNINYGHVILSINYVGSLQYMLWQWNIVNECVARNFPQDY